MLFCDKPLILASASPQRKILLEQLGLSFAVVPHTLLEETMQYDDMERSLADLALRKAQSVAHLYPEALILGADTVISFRQQVLGKPACYAEAYQMLRQLSGQVHLVISGLALVDSQQVQSVAVCTEVKMKAYTEEDIHEYLALGEYHGRAGSYAIQGAGVLLTEGIVGSYTNVVGLPLETLGRLLKERG